MGSKSKAERERLDVASRALCQIEGISNSVLDKADWNTDLHYVLDALGDIARNALDAIEDPDEAGASEKDCAECPFDVADPGDEADEADAGPDSDDEPGHAH